MGFGANGYFKVAKCKLGFIPSRQDLMELQRYLEFLDVVFLFVTSCSLVDFY